MLGIVGLRPEVKKCSTLCRQKTKQCRLSEVVLVVSALWVISVLKMTLLHITVFIITILNGLALLLS